MIIRGSEPAGTADGAAGKQPAQVTAVFEVDEDQNFAAAIESIEDSLAKAAALAERGDLDGATALLKRLDPTLPASQRVRAKVRRLREELDGRCALGNQLP